MAATQIFRAALLGKRTVYRDIEIETTRSLHDLAEAITGAFEFDFDHPFGFYSGSTSGTIVKQQPMYELAADTGGETEARSVKKTSVLLAFPRKGHVLTLVFDYAANWQFHVEMTGKGETAPKLRYPRLVGSKGTAPDQYPDPDDV